MTEPGVENASDPTLMRVGIVILAVGILAVVVPLLFVVSLPIGVVIGLVAAAVYILGLDQLIAQLSMSKTPLLAYLKGPDPDRIPRWVYFGLVLGGLAIAGCLILAYYGSAVPNTTSGAFDDGGSYVLFVLSTGVIRYPMTFLWAFWRAV